MYSYSNSHAGSINTNPCPSVYDTVRQVARHLSLQIAILAQAVAASIVSLSLN